ncbi:hypothetical protein QTH87_03705 [Variovorax sp. J22P168]|uniref:hypothetical protein n=1 Tax=Variovorax jilinensis TaxID=3053513 RepID=UPI00257698A3|nr:hypothetical protein [Variovorax sp. J22P168]MDM0011537.1 hypothetical protein [Variovorax sp. J22P168]
MSRSLSRRAVNDRRFDQEQVSEVLLRWIEGATMPAAAVEVAELRDIQADLYNYPGLGFRHMTHAQWTSLPPRNRGSWLVGAHDADRVPHRVRVALLEKKSLVPVFLIDAAIREPCLLRRTSA